MIRHALIVAIVLLSAAPICTAQQGKLTVSELIVELKKGDKSKLGALEQLEALGEKAAEAAPALVELLPDKNEDVRLAAAIVLGKIGKPAVEPLVKALDSKDADVRFYAVWSLAFVGPNAKIAEPALLKAMSDPAAPVRRKAAYALGRIGADAQAVAPVLVAALADADMDVRDAAQGALPKLGKIAVPAIIEAAKNGRAIQRHAAMKALGEIGADAASAIPVLNAYLLEPKLASGEQAADGLAGIGAPALKTLIAAAAADNDIVRPLALRGLDKMGAAAVPAFVDLLAAKHLDVQTPCRHDPRPAPGAGQIGRHRPRVRHQGQDFQTRQTPLLSLQQMGTNAKLAEPYIVALLSDADAQIRMQAFNVLQSMGVDPRPGLKKSAQPSRCGERASPRPA